MVAQKKKRDENATFLRILETGKKLMSKYGSNGFSIQQLTDMCQMTKGNLYNYIDSKRELYFAIHQREINLFSKSFEDIIQNHPPKGNQVELLHKIGNNYLDQAYSFPDRFHFVFKTDPPISKKPMGIYESTFKYVHPMILIKGVLQEGIEKGEFKDGAQSRFLAFFWGICHGISTVMLDLPSLDPAWIGSIDPIDYLRYAKQKFGDYIFNDDFAI